MDTIRFDGQQEGERVLYEARPEKIAVILGMMGMLLALAVLLVVMITAAVFFPDYRGMIILLGLVIAALLLLVGWMGAQMQLGRNVAYITDRRVVRFSYATPWATTSRALFWDEVVKIKTMAPTWLYRTMNVGTVIVHARESADDLNVEDISYYRDLGNYMDKVMYLYKKEPEKLKDIRAFVPKPRGQRY